MFRKRNPTYFALSILLFIYKRDCLYVCTYVPLSFNYQNFRTMLCRGENFPERSSKYLCLVALITLTIFKLEKSL